VPSARTSESRSAAEIAQDFRASERMTEAIAILLHWPSAIVLKLPDTGWGQWRAMLNEDGGLNLKIFGPAPPP
jgi:hypothetical protein